MPKLTSAGSPCSRQEKTSTDMTEGIIWKHLIKFAMPLLAGNIFQQLYNTVDSVIVGNFVGPHALGAVTSTVPIVMTLIGTFIGFAMGSSVVISQYFGAKDTANLRRATHTSVVTVVLLSAMLSLIGWSGTPFMLRFMDTPEDVFTEAVVYLRIYFLGISGLMLYNFGFGIMRAVGDSKRPLYFLILSSILNIVLDLVFVIAFGSGVAGVAYATIISQFVSAAMIFALLFRTRESHGLTWGEMRITPMILRRIISIGFPTGLQMAITSFSNIFVQSYINAYGAAATSGWGVYCRIDAFAILPMQSMSMASTTFVGQNAGACRFDRIKDGVDQCFGISLGITLVIMAIMYAAAPSLIALFSSDPGVLFHGVLFLRLNTIFDPFMVINQVKSAALRGVGDSRTPMIIMLFSFVLFRQIYLAVASRIIDSVSAMAFGFPVGWMMCSLLLSIHIRRRGWGLENN